MNLLLFLLLLLFLIVGIPLIRGWLYMQRLKQRVNDALGGQQQERSRREDDDDEYTETGERKIYRSGEGEYAEYEEVSGTVSEEATPDGGTRIIVEEQITDAEYEEIR